MGVENRVKVGREGLSVGWLVAAGALCGGRVVDFVLVNRYLCFVFSLVALALRKSLWNHFARIAKLGEPLLLQFLSGSHMPEGRMATSSFRFLHAGDFHLERPLMGVAEVPDHLRELFLEAPYSAARAVFDAALSEDVRFLVLTGGVLVPASTGPRGPVFLAEQFARLAERDIAIFWAGSPIDPPEVWPPAVKLPSNVHFFSCGRVDGKVIQGPIGPLARVSGTSCDERRMWRPLDFVPDASGLYTVAVAHGQAEVGSLLARGIHYWALGGQHDRSTPEGERHLAHYCGTTQGRLPAEAGIHGCTLVQVNEQNQTRTSLIPTDVVRWFTERLVVDETSTRDDVDKRMRQRMQELVEAMPTQTLLISWIVSGSGPLIDALRRGPVAHELLQAIRGDFGFRSPAAWSVEIEVELGETFAADWYEQETIRGDYLRTIRQLQMNPDEPLDLEPYLSEGHRAGTVASMVGFVNDAARDRVLREAAALGVDLLSGDEEVQA